MHDVAPIQNGGAKPTLPSEPIWHVRSGTRVSRVAAVGAVAVVAGLIALPAVASRSVVQDLIFVFTMLALAQLWNVIAGWGGLVSVGQQAFVGLGAYALFACTLLGGIDPLVAIPLAGCFSAIVAALVAPLLFRLQGAYFAIGTWVMAEVCRLLCAQFKLLGGGTGMSLPAAATADMTGLKWVQALLGVRSAAARDVIVYWLALAAMITVTFVIYRLVRSRLGLALTATRDSVPAARSIGIRADRIRYFLWIGVAFATGIVGAIAYLQKARISPGAAFSVTDWTAYVLFIVVIGGARTIEGPIIGILVLWMLQYNLSQYGSLYLIVLGLIAIGMMLFAPKGVWGVLFERTGLQLFPVRRVLVPLAGRNVS